jgi:hypothetical protein
VQQRAMLKEVQMPPGLVFRVMNRAALAPTLCEFRRNPARDSDLMSATVPI